MHIFQYPHVIISVLALIFLGLCIIGICFTIKSVKTSKGAEEKDFSSLGRIEKNFEKNTVARKKRCVVYVSLSLDNMKRLYSESISQRIYEHIKSILFNHLCLEIDGEIAAYGKNNFVALNSLDASEIINCIEKCHDEINKVLSNYNAINVVGFNFGYHITTSTDLSFKIPFQRAKQACSIAEDKDALYCRWDTSNGKEFERKIKIESHIQDEIENNRFFLEYQPILEAKTNKIIGAEVLSRLNSPTEGILTPKYFLSAVNNVGINEEFDYYIFEKNCKWISNDMENRGKYVYTVNFSRQTLCDKNLADNIINILKKHKVDFSSIAIEILEDKNLNDEDKTSLTRNLRVLKEKGILILLDDFGKGYTSFGNLTEFDVDIVKIDKTITQNSTTKAGFLILKNIIKTAHDLGFKTLCEGIETEEHKKLVIDADCDLLQGFYFYRPMPVTQFETIFKK